MAIHSERGHVHCRPLLVGVDTKQANAMKLRQFGNKYGQQRQRVDNEMIAVVFCVETRQKKPATPRKQLHLSHTAFPC